MSPDRFDALADRIADAVAERVLDRLAERDARQAPGEMLTVAEVAHRTGRSPDWVRGHAEELGVRRIGHGVKPRLYFPAARIEALLGGERNGDAEAEEPTRSRRPARVPPSEVELLDYDGYGGRP